MVRPNAQTRAEMSSLQSDNVDIARAACNELPKTNYVRPVSAL
jgi:hypothetical protein